MAETVFLSAEPAPPAAEEHCERAAAGIRLLAIAFTLNCIGLVFVYSASAVRAAAEGWEMTLLCNQALWACLALAGFWVCSRIPIAWLARFWLPLVLFTLALLTLVLMPGVAAPVRGAYRWLRIGGWRFQPSEITKLAMVISLAGFLARFRGEERMPFWRALLPASVAIGVVAGLIAVEPDIGTAGMLAAVLGAMLWVAGARILEMAALAAIAMPPAGYYVWHNFAHIQRRWQDWVAGTADGTGYQTFMSKVALGSGGPYGMGLGQGQAKLFFLPDSHTDFILAIVGQEIGIIGTGVILFLFALWVVEGMRLARLAASRFERLLAFGIVMMIGMQAAFNMAVVTASIPPKGISLPFVSFGGSGLCVAWAATGMLVAISRSQLHAGGRIGEDQPAEVLEIDAPSAAEKGERLAA